MGCGRARAFTATIKPFRDNPTFGLPVLFYSVPVTNPDGPQSPFVDRFWDNRENWLPTGVGMDPASFKPYFGALPPAAVQPLVGSAAEWDAGLLYSVWQAGGYTNPNSCITLAPPGRAARLRQAMQILGDALAPRVTWKTALLHAFIPWDLQWTLTAAIEGTFTGRLTYDPRQGLWVSYDAVGLCPAGQANIFLRLTGGGSLTIGGRTWSAIAASAPPVFIQAHMPAAPGPCFAPLHDSGTITITPA